MTYAFNWLSPCSKTLSLTRYGIACIPSFSHLLMPVVNHYREMGEMREKLKLDQERFICSLACPVTTCIVAWLEQPGSIIFNTQKLSEIDREIQKDNDHAQINKEIESKTQPSELRPKACHDIIKLFSFLKKKNWHLQHRQIITHSSLKKSILSTLKDLKPNQAILTIYYEPLADPDKFDAYTSCLIKNDNQEILYYAPVNKQQKFKDINLLVDDFLTKDNAMKASLIAIQTIEKEKPSGST